MPPSPKTTICVEFRDVPCIEKRSNRTPTRLHHHRVASELGSCFRLQHSFRLIVLLASSRQRRTVDFRLSHAFAMAAVGAFGAWPCPTSRGGGCVGSTYMRGLVWFPPRLRDDVAAFFSFRPANEAQIPRPRVRTGPNKTWLPEFKAPKNCRCKLNPCPPTPIMLSRLAPVRRQMAVRLQNSFHAGEQLLGLHLTADRSSLICHVFCRPPAHGGEEGGGRDQAAHP